jgi:NTE family protein
LLRFIRGKAIGVVLSGGGTRGWAHIGAIKALREAKIPIDIIGGASVGALVACIYAKCQSFEKTNELFRELVIDSKHTISWRSLTWPIISIFNAKKYTNGLMKLFGKNRIEEAWMPFFCITSNLANQSEDIHQEGLMWEKIRATTSLPGVAPPMILDGEMHLDGGLLNNLPVDVMRQFVGKTGKVIAVDLNNFQTDKSKYHFPPIITIKDAFFNKLKIKKHKYRLPSFTDTFLRGLFLNSLLKEKHNAIIANIFVSLDLTAFSMLHSNPDEGAKLMQIGYEETMKQINKNLKRK